MRQKLKNSVDHVFILRRRPALERAIAQRREGVMMVFILCEEAFETVKKGSSENVPYCTAQLQGTAEKK